MRRQVIRYEMRTLGGLTAPEFLQGEEWGPASLYVSARSGVA